MKPADDAKADAMTASAILASFGYDVSPNLIRQWAARGYVRRLGPECDGERGKTRSRTLYAFADIWRRAKLARQAERV